MEKRLSVIYPAISSFEAKMSILGYIKLEKVFKRIEESWWKASSHPIAVNLHHLCVSQMIQERLMPEPWKWSIPYLFITPRFRFNSFRWWELELCYGIRKPKRTVSDSFKLDVGHTSKPLASKTCTLHPTVINCKYLADLSTRRKVQNREFRLKCKSMSCYSSSIIRGI